MSDISEIAWKKLPVDIRRRAVDRLRAFYNESFFEDVRKLATEQGLGNWLPMGWHFGQGMEVRNLLRSDHDMPASVKDASAPIKDAELPPLDEYYGEGTDARNWDDYYIQCVEAAAGLREIDNQTEV